MPAILSAGTLLYRFNGTSHEVLLVHPSGNYNRRAPWSIPKGIPEPGESAEEAARRETLEETGIQAGELTDLGRICYRSGRKEVHGFAGAVTEDAKPECASWEVDRAEFVSLETAYRIVHPDQVPLLERLVKLLRR